MNELATYLPDTHRLLPQAHEAELGVLSSILLAPNEVCDLCMEKGLTPAHFHVPSHATIYGGLMAMHDARHAIDVITLTQALRNANLLDQVGGAGFVTPLFSFLPTAANANYYISILNEKFTLRRMIQVGTEYAARCYDEQGDSAGLLDQFETATLAIRSTAKGSHIHTIKELAVSAINSIQELYESKGKISGLTTGLADLDEITDGLHRKDMIVIAGRPSMGKTALGMNIAEHIAIEEKNPVGVFSLEMSAQQLVQRMMCARARVNMSRLRKGLMAERDFPSLTRAAGTIRDSGLFIDDTRGLNIGEVRARARRMKQQHGIKVLIIDYLQLVRSVTNYGPEKRLSVGEVSNGIKSLAGELDIPILVMAQLNRNPEKRGGGRPALSDLKESGDIEQDADVVGLIHREEYYAEGEEAKAEAEGRASLIIAKQRNGPVGDVALTFLKEFARFETRARDADTEKRTWQD